MSSPEQNTYHRNTNPQSIPLQNLNRPPDEHGTYAPTGAQQHRRTLSDRGRNLLRQTGSIATGQHWHSQYAPIAEASPSPTRSSNRPQLHTAFPGARGGTATVEDGGYSPLEDAGAFQAAIGFSGLGFQGETSPPPIPTPMSSERSFQAYPSDSYPSRDGLEDHSYFGPPSAYEDRARLTDPRNLQPISGTPVTPTARDRSSFQSVRFLTPDVATPVSKVDQEIGHAEAAIGSHRASTARKRSLSPGDVSPLHRAGTIVRNISQRVVNISSDSDIAERTMRRKSSLHHARLQEPPSFPALPEYLNDGASSPSSPVEKPPSPVHGKGSSLPWQPPPNPLRGRTLGIFPPDSKIRLTLCDLLVHPATEPLLLVLIVIQTILLAIESSQSVFEPGHERSVKWGSKIDKALLVLFIIYTVEIVIRVIVSGFIINPVEYSTINRQVGLREAVLNKTRQLFGPQRQPSQKHVGSSFDPQQPSVFRTFTTAPINAAVGSGGSRQQQRIRLAHRAYLRHSFNRTDFVAVISFWTAFCIGVFGVEKNKHIYIFRMLSCLRIIRLLNLTSGTSVILRSLKKAAPLLVNVAFLISFFWLLFAIVGVQSFKSSFRRTCVWKDPLGQNNYITTQACGGHLRAGVAENIPEPYIPALGMPSGTSKGFLCPKGSFCVEGQNPYNNTQSFDNILQSLELVFVIMSSNTWSDLLYTIADSDYLIGALYFAVGILILSLWLISLLIAVITSSFQIIREESRTSAFTGEEIVEDEADGLHKRRASKLKRLYNKTLWLWIVVIAYGLICQALRSASMSEFRKTFIDLSETGVTLILLAEIIIRFIVDWRHFFFGKQNIVDLIIAIITAVIQLPAVKKAYSGEAYAWLTIFQILRIYRVVLAVPMTRDLIVSVPA